MFNTSRRFALSLVASSGVLATCISTASAQRLPTGVTPVHYALSLAPDIAHATFTGSEAIDVSLAAPTDSITLNAAEITFKTVHVVPYTGSPTALDHLHPEQMPADTEATVSLDADKQQATLKLNHPIPAGRATIVITYTGILNNELRGFYLSKGPTRNYAVTQFEATDARRAFPSFDEPAFKATFDIALVVDKGDTVISNTNIISDTPVGSDSHAVRFATTPRMSTYLVAFLVGDFKCISGSSDGTPIRACATPDKVQYTGEALHAAEFFLHYYDTYFGIKYAMPKLDMIGIPDFEAGAMENWGAITYRESDMLVDPKTASLDARKTVDIDVAHEMAHQWFGDLVTMQWWDNIWLNEGFATWMEHKAEAHYKPDWGVDDDVATDLDNTLNLDSVGRTRTIRATANTPDEINQMFDGITYQKGGAVIGMVEKYLGEETFRRGVHDYLNAHKYANATAEDFWGAQTRDSGKPIDKIMSSFIVQPGVPLLRFGAPSSDHATATQSRFFLNPGAAQNSAAAQTWTVPVCVKTASAPACTVVSSATGTIAAPSAAAFFANAGAHGYYRSQYAPESFQALLPRAESTLKSDERILLLSDEWALMVAGQGSPADVLNLIAEMRNDPSAGVIESIGGTANGYSTGDLQGLEGLATDAGRKELAAWTRRQFGPAYAALPAPSPSDGYELSMRRAALFNLLGDAGEDPGVIAQAKEIAAKWVQNPASVDPTLSQPALIIAARHGDAALFDQLQHLAETSADPAVQSQSLNLLARFTDPALETRMLEYTVSGKVRNQDAIYLLIRPFLSTQATRELAWKFIQSHWDQVRAQLTPLSGGYLIQVAGGFCSAEKKQEVDSFYSTHNFTGSPRPLQQADDRISLCIARRTALQPKLAEWLASDSTTTPSQANASSPTH